MLFADFALYGFLRQRTTLECNVHLDLSASWVWVAESPYQEHFVWVTSLPGADRPPFGSDSPLFSPRAGNEVSVMPQVDILEMPKQYGYPEE